MTPIADANGHRHGRAAADLYALCYLALRPQTGDAIDLQPRDPRVPAACPIGGKNRRIHGHSRRPARQRRPAPSLVAAAPSGTFQASDPVEP